MNSNNFKPPNNQTYPSNQPRQTPPKNESSQSNIPLLTYQQYTRNQPIQAPNNYQPFPTNTQTNYQPHPLNAFPTYYNSQPVPFDSFSGNHHPYEPTNKQQQQPNNSTNTKKDLRVKLGPVIGYVTHNSARILVEFNKVEQVTCFLKSPDQETITCQLFSQANKPVVFKFQNLRPKTQYKVTLSSAQSMESSFWTIRKNDDNPGNLKAAIVSCNDISRQYQKAEDKDLWRHLGDQVRNHKLDYVFHIGDQVYMDMAFNDKTEYLYGKCRKMLEKIPERQRDSKKEEILSILRQAYYDTWGHLSVAYVLANVANLTIGDDHEFRDDWGWRDDDYTPGEIDYIIGDCARKLYYEYQRQLREDIPWENLARLPRREYHHHILNGVGVSFMEYRGCRSWYREDNLEDTHIGQAQTDWLEALYGHGGLFEQVNSAIFLTPLPLFVFSKLVSRIAYLKVDDIQEYWTYQSIPQLIKLLDLIRGWKQRRPGRELVIVGGDIHLGGTTDILYADKKIFTQFVCSAINSHESSWIAKGLLDVAMKLGTLKESNYTFMHNQWTKRNNYGVVEVSSNSQYSRIECKLEELKSKKQNTGIFGKIFGNK